MSTKLTLKQFESLTTYDMLTILAAHDIEAISIPCSTILATHDIETQPILADRQHRLAILFLLDRCDLFELTDRQVIHDQVFAYLYLLSPIIVSQLAQKILSIDTTHLDTITLIIQLTQSYYH